MAFQNIVAARLSQTAIPVTALVVYRTPDNVRTFVKDIDIANTTASSISVSVFLVPSGGVPSTATALFYNVPLAGNSTMQWTGAQILNTSDTVQVQASATGCTATITGGEAT